MINRPLTWILLLMFAFSTPIFAQEESSEEGEDKMGGSAFVGGTTLDGINYQQFGIRADLPIWKLGFGLDIQILMDPNGQIRKQDWDEWQDYLDKIYYIRWGHKGDPFYVKFGGLDYSTLGYGNLINGYTNMIEYPTVKRWGAEMSFYGRRFGGELFINNWKEAFDGDFSMLYGARMTYRIVSELRVGVSVAGDLNEFNGLEDADGDGYPDELDAYDNDDKFVTEVDYYLDKTNNNVDYVEQSIQFGFIDGTRRDQLGKYGDSARASFAYSADLGYPIINGDRVKLDIYTHYTQLAGNGNIYGWGVALPGLKLGIGEALTFSAEYRRASTEFLFGFYNYTYELERAQFVTDPTSGVRNVYTKQDMLMNVTEETNGYYVGADFNIAGLVIGGVHYADVFGDVEHFRSIKGELKLTEKLMPKDATVKAYYIQNNVQDFKEYKTPSTIMGYAIGYNFGGVNMGFDYRFTYQDLDGDGLIRLKEENINTFAVKTSIKF